eukprot:609080-Prymnesium_polylepis.1
METTMPVRLSAWSPNASSPCHAASDGASVAAGACGGVRTWGSRRGVCGVRGVRGVCGVCGVCG